MSVDVLLRAVVELESLLSECVGLTRNDAEDHRAEMIQLRRFLTAQTVAILDIGLDALAGRSSRDRFRAEHSALRSAIALHQSNWPISSYDAADVGYRESLRRMQIAYQTFMLWVKVNSAKP